jgi:hypothetical protein
MPTDAIVITVVVLVIFAVFSMVLLWADHRTRNLSE